MTSKLTIFPLFALILIPAFSQTYTGSIRGRVSDPGGLPVPQARVAITELSTNTISETTTNEVGD
jgi:hypothetical protein